MPKLPTYVWHPALYAKSYELQVALDFNFQIVVFDTTTADTTATPNAVLDDTLRFYWRVCGIDSAGAGQFSTVASFVTGTVLDVKGANTSPAGFCTVPKLSEPVQPDNSHQLSVSSKQLRELEGV